MKRIEWIDFGKGFTIFLVVVGHVFSGMFQSKSFIESKNLIFILTQSMYIFHIPVFFLLSGYLFKPLNSWKEFFNEVIKKLIILGIPYVFYSVMQFVLQKIGGDSVRDAATFHDLLNIWRMPYGVAWYLLTLWWISIIFGLISIKIKNHFVLFFISFILLLSNFMLNFDNYLMSKITLWSSFYILGYLLRKSKIIEKYKVVLGSISGVVLVVYLSICIQYGIKDVISYVNPGFSGLLFFASVFLAASIYPKLNQIPVFGDYFRNLGKDSLIIYLVHAPITSVTRIVFLKFGVTNLIVHIVIGTVLAWYGSIFVIHLMSKIPYIDFVFYPMNYLKKSNA